MKRFFAVLWVLCLLASLCFPAAAQETASYTLKFEGDWIKVMDRTYHTRLREVFEKVYPVLHSRFGLGDAPVTVSLRADSDYSGTAYCSGTTIVVSVAYANAHPEDVGFFVHELTHCVQNYGNNLNYSDGWWTENLANYARFRYYHWTAPERVRVYPEDSEAVRDWGYTSYGSCEWFFAYLDWMYPTYREQGEIRLGLVDSVNQLIKTHEGEQLHDDPHDRSSPINALVRRITGCETMDALRSRYVEDLNSGKWRFTGFGEYPDNPEGNWDYPAMEEPKHGSFTASASYGATWGMNLCAGAAVLGVSGQVNDREAAQMLVDGNATTKWCSTVATAQNQQYNLDSTMQWILLDLGEVKQFNSYTILNTKTREWRYGNMTEWELLVSEDGANWVSADYQPHCTANSASFAIGQHSARYLLLRVYNPDDSQTGTIRLYELMLFQR